MMRPKALAASATLRLTRAGKGTPAVAMVIPDGVRFQTTKGMATTGGNLNRGRCDCPFSPCIGGLTPYDPFYGDL